MNGFVKLDCGIVDSSLWIDRDARSLFLTALLMARPIVTEEAIPALHVDRIEATGFVVPPGRYGFVEAAGSGIIRRDGMPLEAGMRALAALCAPDPESRTPDYEGRRLARVDGGYIVLNYMLYRDKDYTSAERQRRFRARHRVENNVGADVTPLRNALDAAGGDSYASASAFESDSSGSLNAASKEKNFEGREKEADTLKSFVLEPVVSAPWLSAKPSPDQTMCSGGRRSSMLTV